MDPNPKSFPIVSYVLARLPSIGSKFASPATTTTDIEQPPPSDLSTPHTTILTSMPHLSDPKVLASMRHAISDVSQTRSILQTLGPRPDHETVDNARLKLSEIEATLSRQLEEIVRSPRPVETDILEWRAHLADKEQQCRKAAEKEKEKYKAVLQLEEMHDAYEKMLKDAEEKLVRIYEKAEIGDEEEKDKVVEDTIEETNEEVTGILVEASCKVLERIDLSNRKLRLLPEAFGKIAGLRVLNLCNNQLQAIPDSISGLENLEELNVDSNLLERLPDSIGLLQNLKILKASSNKLEVLPDTICSCRSLVELDVSFNRLLYLPTNIGYELLSLQRLSIKLNKIRSLPSSIGEMKSLRYLDAHFNELHGLPQTIGKLINLEILDLSSNFSDLMELPETFGDMINLKELDLSNNQIHKLPDTFGRLDNLIKLNLDQNPLEIPPMDVVEKGVEAVKTFMAKRWLDILLEEERKSQLEVQEETQTGWLTRSTSLLKTYVSSVSESVSGYLSPKTPKDPYLDQQL